MKQEFLNFLLENKKGYVNSYISIFKSALPLEKFYEKDLSEFNKLDLITLFKSFSKSIKISTAKTYISLIRTYKEYVEEKKGIVGSKETLTVEDLEKLQYKKYMIINDDDILNITERYPAETGDFTVILLIKLLWETNFEEKIESYMRIKDTDLDLENKAIKINNKVYNISEWLINSLRLYSGLERVSYAGKNGSYELVPIKENKGYIFRKTKNKRGNYGKPLTNAQVANLLYKFSEVNFEENLSLGDIKTSLALKYMVENNKSHLDMVSSGYFTNMNSTEYSNLFKDHAEEKYPLAYLKYKEDYYN